MDALADIVQALQIVHSRSARPPGTMGPFAGQAAQPGNSAARAGIPNRSPVHRRWRTSAGRGGSSRFTMNTFTLAVALLLIWPFSSGHTFPLTAASNVPAASGSVNVQQGDNGNTQLDIKVRHLAQPSNLTPPADVYIAWVRTTDQATHKIGAIRLDSNLNGELKGVTTIKSGDLLITPEQSVSAATPTGPPVLQGHFELQ